ncbi:zinc ABC transporter substrate-binding protein [Wolbachia endosymbiont of Dirofilaria (Dirofilaria) immitis]|uniref:zinc ABC transporter substrate-binding protein n=1 Tax=Wolbachia endosymbiont of Dirofilaria (Dirofilaria) immitis TaxID=1812115 RepID=UPI00158BA505|nr:zinc ABC transporter substrate-binding protein [Wolbachia endosymbiont of Dirofilaria (Dirofilaria) immitis]QKX02240.1 ABC transporter substrate-binding protein [Wolbachia endosymbiont of Dirofilaria (Dirofilaria) immitis]
MKHLLPSFLLLLFTLYYSTTFSSNLKVVATIKPIHSLVASVTNRVLEPVLLDYTTSAHDYMLKPSDASNLESGDVIFYIDDNLETFVKAFAKNNKELVQLSRSVSLLPVRPHSFSRHVIHIQDENDLHIWLSPENAKNMIFSISATLSNIDKKNAHLYNYNAMKTIERIDQEVERIASELNNFKNEKYIVTHDAYQYFEKHFGLSNPNIILSIEEDSYIGMRRLIKLKKTMKEENIKCILSPSWKDSVRLKTLFSDARMEILDPIGLDIKPGKEAYLAIINNITQRFKSCFVEW